MFSISNVALLLVLTSQLYYKFFKLSCQLFIIKQKFELNLLKRSAIMFDVSKQIRLNTNAVKSNSNYANIDQRYNHSWKSGDEKTELLFELI